MNPVEHSIKFGADIAMIDLVEMVPDTSLQITRRGAEKEYLHTVAVLSSDLPRRKTSDQIDSAYWITSKLFIASGTFFRAPCGLDGVVPGTRRVKYPPMSSSTFYVQEMKGLTALDVAGDSAREVSSGCD